MTTANVDAAEIAKFNALADRWWDENSEFKPLHQINPLRLGYINQHVALRGKRVVDIGCGGGLLCEGLVEHGADVSGVDMGEAALAVARIHAEKSGMKINYQATTAEQLAEEEPGAFDVVTCLEMLEHVPDPGAVIQACQRLLKPNGRAFFSTINRNPKSYLFAIVGAEYVLGLLPKGTHEYSKFIKPSELEAWARAAGLTLTDITGMQYNPLTRVYRLGEDVDVNYLMQFTAGE